MTTVPTTTAAVTYRALCGTSLQIAGRVLGHWFSRTLPREMLKILLCRLLVRAIDRLSPGALHHYLSSSITPRGSVANFLLGMYTPAWGMSSPLLQATAVLAFRFLHANACQALACLLGTSHRMVSVLPSFHHVMQYTDDNERYWFEKTVCDWRIVTWMLPGRPADEVGPSLRAVHAAMSVRLVIATELISEAAKLAGLHVMCAFHGAYFGAPASATHGSIVFCSLESIVWTLSVALGALLARRQVRSHPEGTYPATFLYDRAQETAYILFHLLYVGWSLALRSVWVQRLSFIGTRIIPSRLRDEEEFMAHVGSINTEDLQFAANALRLALERHPEAGAEESIPIPHIFGRATTLQVSRVRMTLEYLERHKQRSQRRQRAVSLCSRRHILTESDADRLGAEGHQCTICLSEFTASEAVRTLRCGHQFHDVDILKWLEKSDDCPLCRTPVGLGYLDGLELLCQAVLALPSVLHVFRPRRGDSDISPWILRLL